MSVTFDLIDLCPTLVIKFRKKIFREDFTYCKNPKTYKKNLFRIIFKKYFNVKLLIKDKGKNFEIILIILKHLLNFGI